MSKMYKESVGSNSSMSSLPHYYCNSNNDISNSSTNGDDVVDNNVVDLMCPCGGGGCDVLVSKTQKNANRKFYRCPFYGPKACKFFKWCDEFLITCPPPPCPCGAGLCSVIIEPKQHTPQFFVCPINKGQGACNFRQPADTTIHSKLENGIRSTTDSSPKSTLTHCFSGEISPSSLSTISDNTTVEDESSDISFQLLESESSVTLTPQQHPPLQHFQPNVLPRVDKMPTVMTFQEQEDDIPEEKDEEPFFSRSDHRCKRMRHGDSKTDDVSMHDWDSDRNFDILAAKFEEVSCTDTLANQASHSDLAADEEFFAHQQQHSAVLPCKIFSAAGHTTLPRDSFPSFDPIFLPGDDNRGGTESSDLTDNCGQQLGDGIVKVGPTGGSDEPLLRQISQRNNSNSNIMRESILDVFNQAAARLEEGLVSLLESMEPHEHKSMVREAHLVFEALDNLPAVDYHLFKKHVMGFIDSAVSLSELESSSITSTERSEQDAVDKYNCMQKELEDKSGRCAEASVALTASNNRLNFLIQDEARIKEMLYNVQAEMFCCQVENEEISRGLNKMTQDINKLGKNVKVAKEEVEQARRLQRQRETRDLAKVSFEQARLKLRDGMSRM